MAFSLITVTGTYTDPSGDPAAGSVEFILTSSMMQAGVGTVPPVVQVAELDATGHFSIQLDATNDPSTIPTGVLYEVREQIADAVTQDYFVVLPYALGTVDISDLPHLSTVPSPTAAYLLASMYGVANGVATLDGGGQVPLSELGHVTAGTTGMFNVFAYGAVGNGTTDDTAAIQAAENAAKVEGGIVIFPPAPGGAFALNGRLSKNSNTRWMGSGAGNVGVAQPMTRLKCTAIGAGVDVAGGWGGSIEHMTIDGNAIATSPLRDGTSITTFPQRMLWNSVFVVNSAQDGWYIIGSQNAVYINCRSDISARDNLVLDGGTGGHEFFGFRQAQASRYGINFPWANPGGPYGTFVGSVNFHGGICDNGPALTSQINITNARAIAFNKMTVYGVPATGPAVAIDTSTCYDLDFGGATMYAKAGQPCIKLNAGAGALTTFLMNLASTYFVQGGNSVAIATGTPALTITGWETATDFTTSKASYAGSTDAGMLLRNPASGIAQIAGNGTVVFGYQACTLLQPGAVGNTAYGFRVLAVATTAQQNTGMGSQALLNVTTGSGNTAYGAGALGGITTGTFNVGMGGSAGASITTGTANVAIGQGADNGTAVTGGTAVGAVATAAANYATAIGYGTTASAPGSGAIFTDHTGAGASSSTQDLVNLGTALHTVNVPGTFTVQGVPVGGASTGLAQIPAYNLLPANLPHWRRAVARVISGSANAKIACIGTSVSQGGGVIGLVGTESPPAFVAQLLNSRLCATQHSFGIIQPYSGTYDNRWTIPGSGWTLPATSGAGAGIGWGDNGYIIGANGSGMTLKYTPGNGAVDTFDVWYFGASNTGVVKMNIDGGADTTVTTTNATSGYYKQTLTVASGTTHAVNIHTVTTNAVYIIGVDAYLAATSSVHLGNAAIDGIGTSTFYASAPAVAAMEAWAPDLTIIELGADDAVAASPPSTATFMANIATIVAAALTTGDVLFWSCPEPNPAGPASPTQIADLDAYEAALITYCATNGIPYVDTGARLGAYSEWGTALGMVYTDGVHANVLGNADMGSALYTALKAVV